MNIIAVPVAMRAVRDEALSARPEAPMEADVGREVRVPRLRGSIAAFLRSTSQRQARLANRLDPGCSSSLRATVAR